MIILSIDPGVERTGYALFEAQAKNSYSYLTSGLIKTSKSHSLEMRLNVIYDSLVALIKKYKPKRIVVERLFFTKNLKTAISVAQAQGVIMLAASQHGISLIFYTPKQIKEVVTGYGFSDKKNVQKMLQLTLQLEKNIIQDDQADAVAAGLAYCILGADF